MTPDRRRPDRVPRRHAEPRYVPRQRSARPTRPGERARYGRGPVQSTRAVTMKLLVLSLVGTVLFGVLIAAQMASGNDPALGPKAVAQAKRSTAKSSNKSSSTSSSNGSGTDPYSQGYYGGDGYYYGGDGYSGSSGSSSGSSGTSSYSYSPPPVTSSTS